MAPELSEEALEVLTREANASLTIMDLSKAKAKNKEVQEREVAFTYDELVDGVNTKVPVYKLLESNFDFEDAARDSDEYIVIRNTINKSTLTSTVDKEQMINLLESWLKKVKEE